jgi:hypothetical protein
MSKKPTDPVTYLRSLVHKKGKSVKDGVYFPYPTVTFSVSDDIGSGELATWLKGRPTDMSPEDYAIRCFNGEEDAFASRDDWNEVLVRLRKESNWCVEALVTGGGENLLEFMVDYHDISLRVVSTMLFTEDFEFTAKFHKQLLIKVAAFAGKTPTTVRFSAGSAFSPWDEMVDYGEARAVDVGY